MIKKRFSKPPLALRGMRDILPKEQIYWDKIRKTLPKVAKDFGFKRIDTPLLEQMELFKRTVGEGTDIVEKEMYTFITKGKEKVALRPEFTASIVRAFLENGMDRWPKPVKIYSMGPLFRYERPQEGRYRQHHQLDFEIFGRKDPLVDAQIILVGAYLLKKLGITKRTKILISSIGCLECRKPYIKKLVEYFKNHKSGLCKDCKNRLKKNPLRILDCKEAACEPITNKAPKLIDSLCQECHNHFKKTLSYLEEVNLKYEIDPSLVRGLDYYNRTVFEIVARDKEGNNKYALLGGGRYDGLAEILGGKQIPAIGFGSGIERIVTELMQNQKKEKVKEKKRVFIVGFGELGKKKAFQLFNDLLSSGINLRESLGRDSIKAQLKVADKEKARLALIIGQKEALDETVILRDMQIGSQEIIPRDKILKQVKKMLRK
ncbi:MAG: histidine--tRNA ligase [Candidatus Moranbacteria bacterium]|nr:histidine--tRNA ligase [Candidatus Moranbacteria bacterium]